MSFVKLIGLIAFVAIFGTVGASNATETTPCRPPLPSTLFLRLKPAVLNLSPPYLDRLSKLTAYLNLPQTGLVDSFLDKLEKFESDHPEKTIADFFTYLLTQDRKKVRHFSETVDPHMITLDLWLEAKREEFREELMDDLLEDLDKPPCDDKEDGVHRILEFVGNMGTILWRVGLQRMYRLALLFQYLDPEDVKMTRVISIGEKMSGLSASKRVLDKVTREGVQWILKQDRDTVRSWVTAAERELGKILEWSGQQKY